MQSHAGDGSGSGAAPPGPASILIEDRQASGHLVGDLDGDGIGDLVLLVPSGPTEGAAYLFYGARDSAPTRRLAQADAVLHGIGSLPTGLFPSPSKIGDLNGDGFADLVLTATGAVHFVFGDRARLDGEHAIADVARTWALEAEAFATFLLAGDVQRDGLADLVLSLTVVESDEGRGVSSAESSSYLVSGRADTWPAGAFDPAWTSSRLQAPNGSFKLAPLVSGDLDGDGYSDLLLSTFRQYWLWSGGPQAPRGGLVEVRLPVRTDGLFTRRIPDLDGDGSDELALDDSEVGIRVALGSHRLGSEQGLEQALELTAPGLLINQLAAADLDGDGSAELIVASPSHGDRSRGGVHVMSGADALETGEVHFDDDTLRLRWDELDLGFDGEHVDHAVLGAGAEGDLNGDGLPDLVVILRVFTREDRQAGRTRVLILAGGSL